MGITNSCGWGFHAKPNYALASSMYIHRRQHVYWGDDYVLFQHENRQPFRLTTAQFLNFHDIVRIGNHVRMGRYPLGQDLWFCLRRREFSSTGGSLLFQFHPHSWKRYKRVAHPMLLSAFRHGRRSNHQHDAHNKISNKSTLKPRHIASYIGRQIVSRPPTDVAGHHAKRAECSTVSRRHRADSGKHVPHCRRGDASGIGSSPPPPQTLMPAASQYYTENAALNFELGDSCSVDITSVFEEDCTK